MKLWQKDTSTNEKIDHFTVGNDRTYDLALAPFDCIASKAHAKMLGEIGMLTSKEVKDLTDALEGMVLALFQVVQSYSIACYQMVRTFIDYLFQHSFKKSLKEKTCLICEWINSNCGTALVIILVSIVLIGWLV